ncbi:MAG TPA: DUF488 domain-containing protein [Candidatus Sulfotelmatobacter sp.]|nr:DUF488 domain-containing protein [Candidatus Sulfotelmatobacter sp.]
MSGTIYTIGHSNGTVERLLGLLRQHEITAVADVRSQPYSRYNPQFNREALASALKDAALEYVFLGQELGARSDDPSCYRDGRAQYSLMAKTQLFERGIARLVTGMQRFQLAILCAEKEPLACHRTVLVSRHLHDRGIKVLHILEDGSLEDHDSLLLRLLQTHGMQEQNLFHSKDELIDMAYEKQAEDIQYSADQESQSA